MMLSYWPYPVCEFTRDVQIQQASGPPDRSTFDHKRQSGEQYFPEWVTGLEQPAALQSLLVLGMGCTVRDGKGTRADRRTGYGRHDRQLAPLRAVFPAMHYGLETSGTLAHLRLWPLSHGIVLVVLVILKRIHRSEMKKKSIGV